MKGTLTLFQKEVWRFLKVGQQTLIAPIVSSLLYVFIFAHGFFKREIMPGIDYMHFLIPGLIMMSVLQNAFANTSSSLVQSKVTGNIVFLLLAPIPSWGYVVAYAGAAAVRGFLVALGVYLGSLFFTFLSIQHPWFLFAYILLGSLFLGGLGVVAALWAERIDQIAVFQNFIIMPLTFLSGVFYTLQALPPFWQTVMRFNPFFYLVDGLRFSFLGVYESSPYLGISLVFLSTIAVLLFVLMLFSIGYKLKS
jgi:ABC-2 type transport system permease protein